ncbi:MAG: flavodoxin family protein [Coprobacillus cateniformis]|uniref:flavodoxin family protein n=1 Tax=Longibaculum muris TaxID=1796628 RepID=UPI0029FF00D3|nr:flavodoxin family protein [Coprobacillus cateniformis]
MKITVLQGSPHKNGSSNLLANEFIKGAKENGHSIEVLDVAHMNMHPCLGCGHCGMNGECVYKDDNQTIRDILLSSDMVVFVTPIYYFGMSAQLKMVVDRFYSYTMKLSDKHLKAVLITAAWDNNEDVMPYCAKHYEKLCRYMNFENCGMILGTGCGSPEMTKTSVHMQEAYQLGKSV